MALMTKDVGFIPEHYRGARQLHIEGRFPEAEAAYSVALNQTPEDFLLLFFAGTLFMQTKRYGLGLTVLFRSVELNQQVPEVFNNLGMCLKNMGRHAEAMLAFQRAIRIKPEADYYNNVASMLINTATAQKCLDACNNAVHMEPNHPQAQWNKALAHLELGQWKQGWEGYKWGYRAMGRANRQYDATNWDGKPVGTLVVFGEQGIGDELLFNTILHEAYERADQLIIDCHPRLLEMFQRSFPKAHVYGTRKQLNIEWFYKYERIDAKCSIADLPRLFRNTDGSFPDGKYLLTDPNRDGQARAWLKTLPPGFKVGISWQGGTPATHTEFRCIAPPAFQPLFNVPGVTWVNLQYGDNSQKVADAIRQDHGITIHTNKPLIDDFDSLTSLAGQCDLVISVDQSLVWQCGAIGKECWVLMPDRTSWRFPHRFGARTPWAASLRLFRQEPGRWEWGHVIQNVQNSLIERIGQDVLMQEAAE
jgi:hypothetical protein